MTVKWMAIFGIWMEWFEQFRLSILSWCLQSSFCSRGYMVWKKMLVEEFQDGCWMLGPLWHLNGMISAFLCNLLASHQVSAQEVNGLEDDDVRRIPRWPFSARQSFICKLDDFSISESPCCMKVSKVAKIRNRYNQVPHLTQDTNGKVTNSQKTPQTRAKRSALSQQVTTKHI